MEARIFRRILWATSVKKPWDTAQGVPIFVSGTWAHPVLLESLSVETTLCHSHLMATVAMVGGVLPLPFVQGGGVVGPSKQLLTDLSHEGYTW